MSITRRLINQSYKMSITQIIGAVMLMLGILTLLSIGIYECFYSSGEKISSLIAIGFFLIMLGMVFFFPDMIKSGDKTSTSTMRVVTYMIVSVFIFLCVKIGWNCKSFEDFKIDRTWAYIIGVALGSKAAQTFGENKGTGPNPISDNIASPGMNPGPSVKSIAPNNPVHTTATISTQPPVTPPLHIK